MSDKDEALTSSVIDFDLSQTDQDKLYAGLSYNIWKGLLIGTITAFIWHNTAGFLALAFFTNPIGLIVAGTDVVIFLPLFILAILGMRATKKSRKSVGVLHLMFWASVFYFGFLWAL